MTDTLQIIVAVVGVGVTVLVTVASVAWRLGSRLERVESNLGARLERVQSDLGARLERVESNLGARLERVESDLGGRLERVESDLGSRLERVQSDLGGRLERVQSDLGGRLERVESDLGARLERVESDLGARLEGVQSRVEDLGASIRSLSQQVAATVTIIPAVFRFLHRSQAITDTEYHEPKEQFINRISQGTGSMVDYITRNLNPLTHDEAGSFRELMAKARRGEFFSREEVDKYGVLIRKIEAEHSDDPRIWPLVTLGVFLQGLYPGSRQRDDPQ